MKFLKRIFSPTCLTISLSLLIYTFYKSEIYWNGQKNDYYFTYYIISLILIFFSIITFFLSQKIKEYLIILGASLILGIYLFEGFLTFKQSQISKHKLIKDTYTKQQLLNDLNLKQQLYKKKTGKEYDTRTKLEVYNDLKKINKNIHVNIYPRNYFKKNYSIFPLSGVANVESINCNENGYYSINKNDRYGFNNPDKEWNSEQIEYLLVGDSFIHGACVNRPNDITSVLRTLSNKSALNLGRSGSGPLIEYAILREYLNPNVKKVLWFYFEMNDFWDLTSEMNNDILKKYLDDLTFTQNLKVKQNEIYDLASNVLNHEKLLAKRRRDEFEKNKNERSFISKLNGFLKIYYLRMSIFKIPEPKPELDFKKIIKLTKDLTVKNNSKLYFIYLPEYNRYKSNQDNTNYNLVKNILNELNVPFIDIHKEVFEKEQNPLKIFPFELPGHYNVEGYKKVAETVYKFTKN